MRRAKVFGILAGVALTAFGGCARAATWLADCTAGQVSKNSVVQVSGLTANNTLGFSLLGTPTGPAQITPGPVAGDIIEIKGICIEDVTVTTSGLTIVNDSNSGSLMTTDGIQGQFEFYGTGNTTIDGILIGNASATFTFAGAVAEVANLFVHDGAAVAVKNSQVSFGPLIGIEATRASVVDVQNSTVSSNGLPAGGDADTNMGILAASNATVVVGKSDGTAAVVVQNNAGDGIVASDASSLIINAATVANNTLQQVALLGASSALITGLNTGTTQITALTGGCCQAIFASGASTLDVEQGTVVTGNLTKAAIALDASTLLLQGSVITSGLNATTPSKSEATIHATGNSVIGLAGGNTVCFGSNAGGGNCSITDGGAALAVDHVSTLTQVNPALLGYTAAADSVGGGGQVILQSTVDLGRGLIASNPSLTWVTGSAQISVAQNSSFRLEGGVTITGQINLAQASNGFFNKANGGVNSVNPGVVCGFTTVPASHVVGNAAVSQTPALTLATSMDDANTTNPCLPF
jgi:hypothetical protein